MDEARLAAIQAAAEAATPGEWKVYDLNEGDGHGRPFWQVSNDAFWDDADDDAAWLSVEIHTGHQADAAFIAMARSAVPELLAHVGVLRADNQRLRDELRKIAQNHWCQNCEDFGHCYTIDELRKLLAGGV